MYADGDSLRSPRDRRRRPTEHGTTFHPVSVAPTTATWPDGTRRLLSHGPVARAAVLRRVPPEHRDVVSAVVAARRGPYPSASRSSVRGPGARGATGALNGV